MGKFIPKLAEGDKPRRGEMNSQVLYSEPEGLDTKKDLPTISKIHLKGVINAQNKTVHESCDVLIVGGGMAGTGATEARHWEEI